ncbi:MAG: hypothetical protein WHT65_02010 [Pseudothermotoga sp.]
MRRTVILLMVLFSAITFASYLSFDTNDGVALHLPIDNFDLFVGYRYSGLEMVYPVWNLSTKMGAAIDPFSQSGYFFGGVFVEPASFHVETGVMTSILSDQEGDTRFIKRGNVDLYLKTSYQMNLIGFELTAQKTLLGFYTDQNKDISFVIPPIELESMGVLLQPSVKFELGDSPKVSVKVGYMINLSWTQSLPSALINLYGFRITFVVGDF